MIKTNIKRQFPHHLKIGCVQRLCLWCINHIKKGYCISKHNIYVTDYTKQTENKRTVEVFTKNPPKDICYFTLVNDKQIRTRAIIFNKYSFVKPKGGSRTQCECVIFPENSNSNSWILFLELKYSDSPNNNRSNLQSAIRQLYKTRTYYYQANIFQKSNTCYLLAALPKQPEPFPNFVIPPSKLTNIKKKHNVVLRLQNSASIEDNSTIIV